MKLKADYHFHPNLPFLSFLPFREKRALKRCRQWWEEFKSRDIRAVIITEHVYKNPKRAYELMKKTKPRGFFVFPGIEHLTKDGLDIVIFSDSKEIYSYGQLKPFNMTYSETLSFIKKKKLQSFITHPYTLGSTSVVDALGYDYYQKAVNDVGAVEAAYTPMENIVTIVKQLHLDWLFKQKIKRNEKNRFLPKKDYPGKIKFLAAGSDAHHHGELGTCIAVDVGSGRIDEKTVFRKIVSGRNPQVVRVKFKSGKYWLLVKQSLTALHEELIKVWIKCFRK